MDRGCSAPTKDRTESFAEVAPTATTMGMAAVVAAVSGVRAETAPEKSRLAASTAVERAARAAAAEEVAPARQVLALLGEARALRAEAEEEEVVAAAAVPRRAVLVVARAPVAALRHSYESRTDSSDLPAQRLSRGHAAQAPRCSRTVCAEAA